MRHRDIEGSEAVHPFAYVSNDDPADDPLNEVAPGKAWYDSANNRLRFRNEENTLWLEIGET